MFAREQLIAVVSIFLLLTAGCTRSKESESAHTTGSDTSAAHPDSDHAKGGASPRTVRDKLTLGEARELYRAQYRLEPDRQFLLAIAEIHHFLTGQQLQRVETSFSDKYWHVRYAGIDVGRLSELADFDELYTLLVNWSEKLNGKYRLLPDQREARAASDAALRPGHFAPSELLIELRTANDRWQKGEHTKALLERAADMLVKVSAQRLDLMQVGDPMAARALSMMALCEAACQADETDNKCLIADSMQYSDYARNLSLQLPAGNPLRLYFSDDEKGLLELSSGSSAASEEAGYLMAKLLARKDERQKWNSFVAKRFSGKPAMTLSLVNTLLPIADDSWLTPISNLIIGESLAELQAGHLPKYALTADQLEWSSEMSKAALDWMMSDLLAQFERALRKHRESERSYKSAQVFCDPEITESYYFSCFSSAVYLLARAYFALPFQRVVCEDFARSLHVQKDSSAHELEVWLKDRIALKMQLIPSAKLASDLENFEHLGAPALINIFTDLGDYNVFDSPANVITLSRKLFTRLDGRLCNRLDVAQISDETLLDVNITEALIQSVERNGLAARLNRRALHLSVEQAASVPSAVKQVNDPKTSSEERLKLLAYLQWQCFFKPKINARLRRFVDQQYRAQVGRQPHNWPVMHAYGEYLLQFHEQVQLRDQLQVWLAKQTSISPSVERPARCLLAQAYYELKDYRGGLSALGKFRDNEDLHCAIGKTQLVDGLGQKREAEQSMRELLDQNPKNPDVVLGAAQMFWSNEEYDKAARVIKAGNITYANWADLSSILTQMFPAQPQNVILAVEALRRAGFNDEINLLCEKAYFLGKSELAFSMASVDLADVPENYPRFVSAFKYLKDWKNRKQALQWICNKVSIKNRSTMAWAAFTNEQYELLWDFIPTELPGQDSFVWVLRAAAAVDNQRLSSERRKQLKAHFAGGQDSESALGRYLVEGSQDIFSRRLYPREICSSAFFIAWKGLRKGDAYNDVNAWLHVALASGQFRMPEYEQSWSWLKQIQQEIVNQATIRKTARVRVARIVDQPEGHSESPFNPGCTVRLE